MVTNTFIPGATMFSWDGEQSHLPQIQHPAFNGTKKITGTVKDAVNAALRRELRLYPSSGAPLLATTMSDATTGQFTFDYLSDRFATFMIECADEAGSNAPEVKDRITPVPM